MTIETNRYVFQGETQVTARIPDNFWPTRTQDLYRLVMERLADRIADAYIEKHGIEAIGLITPEAVASLAVANAAGKVAKAYALPEQRTVVEHRRHY